MTPGDWRFPEICGGTAELFPPPPQKLPSLSDVKIVIDIEEVNYG